MNLQVGNLPDDLHWEAKRLASSRKQTLKEFVIQAIREAVDSATEKPDREIGCGENA